MLLQKEAVSLKESLSQNVVQTTPTSEEIPSPPDFIPQDFSAHLFPSTSQEFASSSNAVLKSTNSQVLDLNALVQAISSPQVVIPFLPDCYKC